MPSKKELLAALARSDDERLLLSTLLDKEEACRMHGYLTSTRFLDLNERTRCTEAVRRIGAQNAVFWGGYDDAERVMCLFYPDYLDEESAKLSAPIALLRAHKPQGTTLQHRDYLGALMGLGIERWAAGDILVHDGGADLFVLDTMADFIAFNYGKAGRGNLKVTREEIGTERRPALAEREGQGSVAAPRLDSVIALCFHLSRADARARIEHGLVFIDHAPCLKPERQVAPAETITVRGLGRAKIDEIGGVSRKGRVFVHFTRQG